MICKLRKAVKSITVLALAITLSLTSTVPAMAYDKKRFSNKGYDSSGRYYKNEVITDKEFNKWKKEYSKRLKSFLTDEDENTKYLERILPKSKVEKMYYDKLSKGLYKNDLEKFREEGLLYMGAIDARRPMEILKKEKSFSCGGSLVVDKKAKKLDSMEFEIFDNSKNPKSSRKYKKMYVVTFEYYKPYSKDKMNISYIFDKNGNVGGMVIENKKMTVILSFYMGEKLNMKTVKQLLVKEDFDKNSDMILKAAKEQVKPDKNNVYKLNKSQSMLFAHRINLTIDQ